MVRGKQGAEKLRTVLPLGAVSLFTLILFATIVPLDQFSAVQALDFTSLVFTFWLVFVGLLFISLGIISLPEVKSTPARFAGFFFIAFGLIALVFALVVMVDGSINVLLDDSNLRFFATILFFGATIILFADLVPRIISGKGMVQAVQEAT